MKKNFTLVHIITTLGGGGAEKMVLDLSQKSLERNQKVVVISVTSINDLEPKFREHNIPYHFLDIDSFGDFRTGLKKLVLILDKLDNKVLHCHMFHALIVGLYFNAIRKASPLVFTVHSNMVEEFYRKLIYYFTQPFRKFDIIFTPKSKKWFLKNNAVIPNGIMLEDFKFDRETSSNTNFYNFLFLGRLNKEKNPLALIDIARSLTESGEGNFKFNIVGDGYLKEELENLISEKKLSKYFKLYGFRTDISEIVKGMDCLLITSHWEGMPISLLECGASALPVLSRPVGTIPEILDEGRGFVSNLEEFPNYLKSIISNYPDAAAKGKALQRYILQNFDIDKVYEENLSLYQALI